MRRYIQKLIQNALQKRGLRLVRYITEDDRPLKADGLPGWFSKSESMKLYSLGLITNGPILEIGHFLGKTTACLCEAIHDSKKDRPFYSYDLGFKSVEEFKKFYDEMHQKDVPVPPLFVDLVFSKNMTTTQLAINNLKEIGLDTYVNLISGNFIEMDQGKYNLIFCDAMHTSHEIKHNVPHIIERSAENCLWAFHDMNQENVKEVLHMTDSIFIEMIDSLGVFLYQGGSQ